MLKTNRLLSLLVLITLFLLMPTAHASAMLTRCRTDPIFTLSNGEKITVVLDINTNESGVIYVNYVLHVPAGVTVKNVVFTAGGIGKLETYWIRQDSPANTYTTESFVLTQQSGVAVIATTSLQKIVKSVAGYSGQNLIVTIRR
jgi:hypothetical protein